VCRLLGRLGRHGASRPFRHAIRRQLPPSRSFVTTRRVGGLSTAPSHESTPAVDDSTLQDSRHPPARRTARRAARRMARRMARESSCQVGESTVGVGMSAVEARGSPSDESTSPARQTTPIATESIIRDDQLCSGYVDCSVARVGACGACFDSSGSWRRLPGESTCQVGESAAGVGVSAVGAGCSAVGAGELLFRPWMWMCRLLRVA
jgi:hypothetical protein